MFDIDSNGIVKVNARETKTNKKADITIQSSGGLSQAEVERLVQEAENLSVDDNVKLEIAQMKSRARETVMNTEQALTDHGDKISAGLKEEVATAISALHTSLDGLDPIAVRTSHDNLQKVTSKIGMEILNASKK